VLAHVLFGPVAFYRYLPPLPVFVVTAACTLATERTRLRSRTDDFASAGETTP
jgi:hypothetical protein